MAKIAIFNVLPGHFTPIPTDDGIDWQRNAMRLKISRDVRE